MIEIKNCSKAFGKIQAVNKVTMDIGEREVFGLIGSNGAGKSTLLRIMAGIIRQDRGEVLMDEEPVLKMKGSKSIFLHPGRCIYSGKLQCSGHGRILPLYLSEISAGTF
mgnify:CR=1 FL=1